ncbi:MAG: fibronectin type III domain-containing protein [Verrucomicrobia bacterium]|nr:fibronectin type III domain-containing protein [Verrucomicrobiota bacterium]
MNELEPGGKYWFRVAAINAHGQGPWSQIASTRAG